MADRPGLPPQRELADAQQVEQQVVGRIEGEQRPRTREDGAKLGAEVDKADGNEDQCGAEVTRESLRERVVVGAENADKYGGQRPSDGGGGQCEERADPVRACHCVGCEVDRTKAMR